MDKLSRLGALKNNGTVCIKTVAGQFIGVVIAVSPTEIEVEQIGCHGTHEKAYIPIEEVRMILVDLAETP